jgi:hypothetical protein
VMVQGAIASEPLDAFACCGMLGAARSHKTLLLPGKVHSISVHEPTPGCSRQFLRKSKSVGAQQAAVAGDRHLGDWLKGQPVVVVIRSRFIAKHAGDGRDDALRGVVLDILQVMYAHL